MSRACAILLLFAIYFDDRWSVVDAYPHSTNPREVLVDGAKPNGESSSQGSMLSLDRRNDYASPFPI
jgi:hypothetical protein